MAYEFKTRRIIEFAETDLAGVVHFANYFRYMEAAEHEFFRSLGLSVHHGGDSGEALGGWGFARVQVECRYSRPLCSQDQVDIHVLVTDKRSKSISYAVVFRKNGQEVARGSMVAVCVTKGANGEPMRSRPIPQAIDEQIEVAPPEVL
jgi:YbgC/YbaW family acyl-CoA thioester hydrolase